jgi:hypothetical protein
MLIFTFITLLSGAWARPAAYTELLDYVIAAPDQGKTATCLYVGSTGAMEILLNKKHDLKHQRSGDRFDLGEPFLIHQPQWNSNAHRVERVVLKFNHGKAIHASNLPWEAWLPDGVTPDRSVWNRPPGYAQLPRISVPKVQTQKLFVRGDKWDTNVLKRSDVEMVKEALWTHRAPVLINYNDSGFWHIITIVGYDDSIQEAACYETNPAECAKNQDGAFYIRDSFGVPIETRDTDWFRIKGSAAFVVKLAE